MASDERTSFDAELLKAGAAVARLPQAAPERDLAARTLARLARECKPIKQVIWFLRPVTHPLARLAAAAAIIAALAPLTSIDTASPLGRQLEQHVLGARMTDHIETFVDRLLVSRGVPHYSQDELDAAVGVYPLPPETGPRGRGVRNRLPQA